ncbi:MAG: hypothetical protein ACQUHE_03375 [Bacteroidia bacterium]
MLAIQISQMAITGVNVLAWLSYEAAKDFILPIILTLLAGGFAYLIFVKETRRDQKMQWKADKQIQRDKLSYFSNVVKNVISISEQQNASILAFVEEQRAYLTEGKQLLQFSLNEFRRVTTDLQLEDYMLAYVNHYKEDRQISIKEFNKIIVRIDMLYGTFKVMEPHLQFVQEDERQAKERFIGYFESASKLVAVLALRLRQSAPQLEEEMNAIAGASLGSKTEKRDLEFCYRTFIVPFNTFAFKYAFTALAETPQIQELATLTKDAKSIYEQIVDRNESLADDFHAQYIRLKPEIEQLKEYSKRLIEDF